MHSPILLFTLPYNHPCIALTNSFTHPLPIHSPIDSPIHSSIHSTIHSSINLSIQPPIHSPIDPFTHPSIHYLILTNHPFINRDTRNFIPCMLYEKIYCK